VSLQAATWEAEERTLDLLTSLRSITPALPIESLDVPDESPLFSKNVRAR